MSELGSTGQACTGASASEGAARLPIDVMPEMISAGVAILYELEGETSKATLAREVFRAMEAAAQSAEQINIVISVARASDLQPGAARSLEPQRKRMAKE